MANKPNLPRQPQLVQGATSTTSFNGNPHSKASRMSQTAIDHRTACRPVRPSGTAQECVSIAEGLSLSP
jgi:hypothetical protein